MKIKLLSSCSLLFILLMSPLYQAYAGCPVAELGQVGFCQTFSEEAHCRCTEKAGGLAPYFCQGSMQDLYRLMKTQYGTLQKACRMESSHAPKVCETKWIYYNDNCQRVFS